MFINNLMFNNFLNKLHSLYAKLTAESSNTDVQEWPGY